MVNGSITLGRWEKGIVLLKWESSVKPLILARGLLRKAWYSGFSTKEYLILFDLISTNFKRWDRTSLNSGLMLLFLIGSFRKKITSWDSSTPSLKSKLSQILSVWGVNSKGKKLLDRFRIKDFLNVPELDRMGFSMKVFHVGEHAPIPSKKVRNPSAVGSKSMKRKALRIRQNLLSPEAIPRTLDEEITLMLKELFNTLGIKEAKLPLIERTLNLSEETSGKVEIPETHLFRYVSIFEERER